MHPPLPSVKCSQVRGCGIKRLQRMNNQKRNNISFTPQHKLEDAEQEYIEAIYRFRRAEQERSADYASSKREMLRLEAKLANVREHIYRGTTYELLEPRQMMKEFVGCPEPAWGCG